MASPRELQTSGLSPASVPGAGHALPGSVEALFPAGPPDCAPPDADPDLGRLTELLRGLLVQYEPLLLWLQRLLVWERPVYSVSAAVTLHTLFWLLSSTSLRPLFLLSVSLLGLMLLERWKHKLPLFNVQQTEAEPRQRDPVEGEQRLLSVPELSHHLADSYLTCCLYLQEMLQYKQHNHGKFCALTCSGCLALALVGHYVPGVMISYIIVLSVLLWPLVVYHELIQRMYTGLEPILMKLDYSMKGETERRKHDKRKVKKEQEGDEPRAETESESEEEEEELCCFAPTVDVKTTALAMAITDSELSDEEASILESGGFSVSRATTPQLTDVFEDLDQQSLHSDPEEAYLRDLPEFPSVEEFPSEPSLLHFPLHRDLSHRDSAQSGASSDGEPLSPTSLLFQHLASPLHFVNTHFNGHPPPGGPPPPDTSSPPGATSPPGAPSRPVTEEAQRSLEALSEEIVNTAISTIVHNTLTALLGPIQETEDPTLAEFMPSNTGSELGLTAEGEGLEEVTGEGLEKSPGQVLENPVGEVLEDIPGVDITGEGLGTVAGVGLEKSAGEGLEREATEGLESPVEEGLEEEDFELLDQSELEQAEAEFQQDCDRPLS